MRPSPPQDGKAGVTPEDGTNSAAGREWLCKCLLHGQPLWPGLLSNFPAAARFIGEESVLLPDLQQPQLILQRDQAMLHAGPDQEIWHKNSSHSKTGTQSVIKFSSVDSAYSQIKAEHTA